MGDLYKALEAYGKSDYYPFHMPGHKRNISALSSNYCYQIDISEIDGFDNLHHAEGILQQAMRRAAKVYQSEETYFLVNGSTGGILSAISAVTDKKGKILLARNSHKAAFNAVCLRELETIFLYPRMEEGAAVSGGILPEDVAEALRINPCIQAVFITSPTYDGVVSDVEEIASIVHEKGIPLVVDEAHGAHFGFHSSFPQNSIQCKADIVIHSVHKTLPAMTQTAILHVNGDRVNRKKLQKFLSIYQSSSPSYVLMAGIDECIFILEKESNYLFTRLAGQLEEFYRTCQGLNNIYIIGKELIGHAGIYDVDPGKIIISVKNTTINGQQLYELLLHKYHLQMEMAASDYVLGIATIMDIKEGLKRLSGALLEIDQTLRTNLDTAGLADNLISYMEYMKKTDSIIGMHETEQKEMEQILLLKSKNRISCEFVYLYPPGIPILIPGEVIMDSFLELIVKYRKQGFSIQGLEDYSLQYINVVK